MFKDRLADMRYLLLDVVLADIGLLKFRRQLKPPSDKSPLQLLEAKKKVVRVRLNGAGISWHRVGGWERFHLEEPA